jgi:DnaA N-terminal domain
MHMWNTVSLPSGDPSNQSRATAKAPSWESTLLRAHEELTKRWQLRIGAAKTAVVRVLLDNLQNGTRAAIVPQEEIARGCSFHRRYVRRLLRSLDRDDHLIQRVKRQGVSMYRISRALLPDYVPDAPQPMRIPPPGPLLGDNLVPIQSGTPVPVSNPDRHPSTGLTGTPVPVRSLDTKGTRALGRKVGDRSQTTDLPTYLPADEEEEAVLEALQTYATEVNQAGARKLIRDWRQLKPDVTTDEIIHFVHRKGANTNRSSVESLANVLVCSAKQYGGLDLDLYRKQRQRRQQESEAREREAQEQQRRAAELQSVKGDDPWSHVKTFIKDKIASSSYGTWVEPTRYSHSTAAVLFVRVPNSEFCCIGERYGDLISAAIEKLGLQFTDVEFISDPTEKAAAKGGSNA